MNQERRRAGMESVHASWPPLALRRTVDQGAPKSARSVPRFGSAVSPLARRGHLQATGRAQKRAFRQAAHHRMQTAGGRQTGCRRQVGGKPDADGRWAANRMQTAGGRQTGCRPATGRRGRQATGTGRPAGGRRAAGGGRRSEPGGRLQRAARQKCPRLATRSPRAAKLGPKPARTGPFRPHLTPPPKPHARRGRHRDRVRTPGPKSARAGSQMVIGLPTARRHRGRATGPRRPRFPPTSATARVAAAFHRSSGLVVR